MSQVKVKELVLYRNQVKDNKLVKFETNYRTQHWSANFILAPKNTLWCYIMAITIDIYLL